MMPMLYSESLESSKFTNSNGMGHITCCKSCTVTQNADGNYIAELIIFANEPLLDIIEPNKFLKIKANSYQSPQLFEIYTVENNGMELKITARHIKYLCCQNLISNDTNNYDFTLKGKPQDILNEIAQNLMFDNYFTFESDISESSTIDLSEAAKMNLGDIIAESDGSIKNVFNAEIVFDNFKISFLKSAGRAEHSFIYGSNVAEYTQKYSNESAYSHYMGYAKVNLSDKDENKSLIIGGDIVQTSTTQKIPKVKLIDFTQELNDYFGSDFKVNLTTGENYQDAKDMILYFTNQEFIKGSTRRTDVTCSISAKIKYVDDSEIHMYDDVTIILRDGAKITSKITELVYDSLKEKYTSISVGDKVLTLSDYIKLNRR